MGDDNQQSTAPNGLKWHPDTYYRLRNNRLVARITEVAGDRLKGEIFATDKVRRESEQWRTDAKDVEARGEWDLNGNSMGVATQDLMEVLR